VFLMLCMTVNGQITYGLKAGINYSTIGGGSAKEADEVNALIGPHGGAFAQYKFRDNIAVQGELLGSYQGANAKVSRMVGTTMVDVDQNFKLAYILLPVMVQFYPMPNLRLEWGPQIGYNMTKDILITANVRLEGDLQRYEQRMDDLHKWDFALNAGMGYEFTESWAAVFRYSHGFTSLDKTGEYDFQNRVISLSAEYRF
ncbi:MAG: porin family protein, partial [Weeksellaceae bacterium]|nr:porin family protein [Weeksellaceae bacterium]